MIKQPDGLVPTDRLIGSIAIVTHCFLIYFLSLSLSLRLICFAMKIVQLIEEQVTWQISILFITPETKRIIGDNALKNGRSENEPFRLSTNWNVKSLTSLIPLSEPSHRNESSTEVLLTNTRSTLRAYFIHKMRPVVIDVSLLISHVDYWYLRDRINRVLLVVIIRWPMNDDGFFRPSSFSYPTHR